MNAPISAAGYVVEPLPIPSLPVKGSDKLFPVHRIYCVGRNYAEHAIEMGHDPSKEPPFFFQKNPDNVVTDGKFPYPGMTSDVHFEIEMVVALGKGGVDIPAEKALDHVFGYGVGLDMTRRDLQGEAKKLGRPWEVGKAFEASAPCTALVPAAEIGHPHSGARHAESQRRPQATGRPQPDDLEGAGNDRLSVAAVHPAARRHHHVRHAGRRRRDRQGRCAGRFRRGRWQARGSRRVGTKDGGCQTACETHKSCDGKILSRAFSFPVP